MRALSSIGIFCQTEYKKFCLNPMAELLKKGNAGYIYSLMFHSEWNDKAWLYLYESVKTGKTAFELAHGMPLFEWLKENKKAADFLNEANSIRSKGINNDIFNSYDFSKANKIIDIGGGKGCLLFEILKKHPSAKGIIAELSSVALDTNAEIRNAGMQTRCKAIDCDFFEKVPPGADVYILSNILHD